MDYKLEKSVWTEKDFDIMGWHDCVIYSMVANPEKYEYMIDLDYIFKWIYPVDNEVFFKFWVAPATMVFENVYDIKLGIESSQGLMQISDLHKGSPQLWPNKKGTSYHYLFETQEGEISLTSSGFKMYIRSPPQLLESQFFGLDERGGVSFSREYRS